MRYSGKYPALSYAIGLATLLSATSQTTLARDTALALEEITVTAQKRQQPLFDTPVAITVLSDEQLYLQGVSSLGDLARGSVASLNVQPYANTPSTLVISIRGNGPGDIAQTTRDSSVAVYLDEVYLGRAQGLDAELPDLERVEILRGPQGTLFGRNATAGAVSFISKKPTGEFSVEQTVSVGNYNLSSSTTHLNLPKVAGISAKVDVLFSERDGWVENTARGEADYNEFNKKGLRLSTNWESDNDLSVDYAFMVGDTKTTQNYFQFHDDSFIQAYGNEPNRETKTRAPVTTLEPTKTKQTQHTVNIDFPVSDSVRFKSISSYRELADNTNNNYGGTLYFGGYIEAVDVEQEQFSQELRFTGSHSEIEWVAGAYYYKENVDEELTPKFTQDDLGNPVDPPTNVFFGDTYDPSEVNSELESKALFGQLTYTPTIFNDDLSFTFGARYNEEERSGVRSQGGFEDFTLDESHLDPTFIVQYRIGENISTYAKYSSAFRSGGVNVRSTNLTPFEKEEAKTTEVGLKVKAWDQRLRANTAVFYTETDEMFIDISTADLSEGDTINSDHTVRVEGAEVEVSVIVVEGLVLGLNYTYLNGKIPPQANPLNGNIEEEFLLTQTPEHAGSMTVDYMIASFGSGELLAHLEVVSTDSYFHYPSGGTGHPDGYTLLNGRLELANLKLGQNAGSINIGLWGKNLTDEEYILTSFGIPGVSTIQAFGEPRTAGMDVRFNF